jgi:hypothetical protein
MRHYLIFFTVILFYVTKGFSQELYIFSNPASNIPAKSLVLKGMGKSVVAYHDLNREYRFASEIQVGIHKNLMVAGGLSFSDMYFLSKQQFESYRIYAKYRFLSKDGLHQHFRMAAHASYSRTNNPLVYQELNTEGDNTGFQTGLIATGLVNKLAVSGGLSYMQLEKGKRKINLGLPFSNNAFNYNLSLGYLLFPFKYKDYRQVNLNLYCELLGQKNTDINRSFIDVAPAIQLIVASRMRINAGARFQLSGNTHRMANEAVYVSLEYYILNALK